MNHAVEFDKQTAILQSTLDLIAEQGFHATPVSQIAKRSGVSAGIIYHYFDSKEALIHELYRQIKLRYSDALMVGEPHLLPFPDNMRRLWLNAYHFYITHPKEAYFIEQYDNSPYYQVVENDNFKLLVNMVQQLIADGIVRQMQIYVLYDLTLGVATALAKRQLAGTVALNDAELEQIALLCCRAVQP